MFYNELQDNKLCKLSFPFNFRYQCLEEINLTLLNIIKKSKYLEYLDLTQTTFNSNIFDKLCNILIKKNITHLKLQCCCIENMQNSIIKLLQNNKNIRYLNLSYNRLDKNINELIDILSDYPINTLKLAGNQINETNVVKLIQNENLTSLNISENHMLKNKMENILDLLQFNTHLCKLNINAIYINNPSEIHNLIQIIKNNTTLVVLKMNYCLGIENFIKLLDVLKYNKTIYNLQSLLLDYQRADNLLLDTFHDKLCNLIRNNKVISTLILNENMYIIYNNYIKYYQNILDALNTNTTLTDLKISI
jgi:hypothetical protein